jgi:hypothetical protein
MPVSPEAARDAIGSLDNAPVMRQRLPLLPPVPVNFCPVFPLLSAIDFAVIVMQNQ